MAKDVRPKDDEDFEAVLPSMDPSQTSWLIDTLRSVHPGHPWVDRIEAYRRSKP